MAAPMVNPSQVGGTSPGALTAAGAGTGFRGMAIFTSDRYQDLDRKQSFYDCTQHGAKLYDFEGRAIQSGEGVRATQPLLSSEKVPYYVPLRMRRPSSPYRLNRVIVNAFTSMVFGENRFPQLRVDGDDDSDDFTKTLARVARLPVKAIQGRNLAGAMGTVGYSWCFSKGRPRIRVHNPKHLFVHEWDDREELVPRSVTEAYLYPKDEWDPQRKRFVRNHYWYRRDWTPEADLVFLPVKFDPRRDPAEDWQPDPKKSNVHGDNLTHFEWVQNLPSEEIDGYPDSEGLWENFDVLDIMLSVIVRGAVLNLDPTLVLSLDPDQVRMTGVKKGSDNALIVGEGGDAKYLELSGQSIEAGISLFNTERRTVLEVARCVLPDPDTVAAAGSSSVAQKMVYATMLPQCDLLREQHGAPIQRMMEKMGDVARAGMSSVSVVANVGEDGQPDGSSREVQKVLALPKRVVKTPKKGDDGKPTGEHDVEKRDRVPGEGGEVELQWGPFFPPTPADQQATATALTTATAGAAVMSVQTGTELMMQSFGRDPGDEAARVAQEKDEADQKQSEMFAAAGGPPGANGMPPGASPKGGKPGGPPKPPGAPKGPPGAPGGPPGGAPGGKPKTPFFGK